MMLQVAGVSEFIAEIYFSIIGIIFILVGLKALEDTQLETRVGTAVFWFLLALTFIFGPYIPHWISGIAIILIACLSAQGQVKLSKSDVPTPEESRENANRLGNKVFIPALGLAIFALVVATLLPALGANNAIGISATIALVIAFFVTKAKPNLAVKDGVRLMDSVGPTGILPQLLAALGAVFTVAGIGNIVSGSVSAIIPEGNRLAAVIAYCVGMALFTVIMGNGFAAFSVITVGIGIPFLIAQGANPVVVGALGLTAGYCGTLLTPMAANFNIMPAALLETKNKYMIIKAQVPVAITMLVVHVALMYFLAF
ncbi:membrane protein [Clostridia bacterium]|nr:membrane protein [Clostridia bacterium]